MNTQVTIAQWQRLQAGFESLPANLDLPDLDPVQLSEQHEIHVLEQLPAVLEQMQTGRGWLMLSGEVKRLPANIAVGDRPLQGEVVVGEETWQLRYRGDGTWQVSRFQLAAAMPDQATHLATTVCHLANDSEWRILEYCQLWSLDDSGRPIVQLAILTDTKE